MFDLIIESYIMHAFNSIYYSIPTYDTPVKVILSDFTSLITTGI